jgi:hypothetical protein
LQHDLNPNVIATLLGASGLKRSILSKGHHVCESMSMRRGTVI